METMETMETMENTEVTEPTTISKIGKIGKITRAGVPTFGYRSTGGLFRSIDKQEDSHIRELDAECFCKDACEQIDDLLIKYLVILDAKVLLSCTAFTCLCDLDMKKMSLRVSNLVFDDMAVKYGLSDMLLASLVCICMFSGNVDEMPKKRLNLHICDPIPPVKAALEKMWCPWSPIYEDPNLRSDKMEEAFGKIPDEIRRTRCCPSLEEFLSVHEWVVGLPKIDPALVLACTRMMNVEYIESLECMLYRLAVPFKRLPGTRRFYDESLGIAAACVKFRLNWTMRLFTLDWIVSRPCLQGLGIFRMVLFAIMDNCVRHNVDKFTVSMAYASSISVLKRIGGFKTDHEFSVKVDYTIELAEMRTKTLAACGLEGRMREHEEFPGYFVIDPSYFPTAEQLNSQEEVDKRFANGAYARQLIGQRGDGAALRCQD